MDWCGHQAKTQGNNGDDGVGHMAMDQIVAVLMNIKVFAHETF